MFFITDTELINFWDNDKNLLDPNTITVNSNKYLYWKCKLNHSWQAYPYNLIKNPYCPICNNKKLLKGFNDLETKFSNLIKEEWDFQKNTIKPSECLPNNTKKVFWKCKLNHSYKTQIREHIIRNVGCPYCSNKKILKGFNDFGSKFPNLLLEWSQNNTINPFDISAFSHTKVEWVCKYNHCWTATIASRTHNHNGCPICSKGSQTSFAEQFILYVLQNIYKLTIVNRHKIETKEVDIYIPKLNIGIEYNGFYFHKDKSKDLIKEKFLNLKVKMLYIIEHDEDTIIEKNNKLYVYHRKTSINNLEHLYKTIEFIIKHLKLPYKKITITEEIKNIIYKNSTYVPYEKSLAYNYPLIANEWDYKKNNLTPKEVYPASNIKAFWLCSKYKHSYQCVIANRTRATKALGCPICSNRKVLKGYNDFATTNPTLLKEWDYSKNTINPTEITNGSKQKVYWLCKLNHSYDCSIVEKVRGSNCPYCSGHRVLKGFNDLFTKKPFVQELWDYEKNTIDPYTISSGSATKIWLKCKLNHSYRKSPCDRSLNCPICSNKQILTGFNDLATKEPILMLDWSAKNVLNPHEISQYSNQKAIWKCHVCSYEWESKINNRTSVLRNGCPNCAKIRKKSKKKK